MKESRVLLHVGEVIESCTTEFVAQCCKLHTSPPFGSLVRVESEPPIYALVYEIITHSIDPTRRPMAYGKTEEELREEQPQIFELLKTDFRGLIVGYEFEGAMRQALPPIPPKLHSFVYECDSDEVRRFTEEFDYLRLISASGKGIRDELLIAACRHAWEAHDYDHAYLVSVGKELSRLIKDDYDRLRSILRRISKR
ncbi:MAG: hypothetical protein RMK18_02975 [Armatimonadota bacterium]|nr:hypothetical protein [Armatimonadota bacterium]MCX7776978.1 hypothetical protein [Armatimonadota bacterium]MDW8024812.1 hypothetical protein [Armatimonadota bacterium]